MKISQNIKHTFEHGGILKPLDTKSVSKVTSYRLQIDNNLKKKLVLETIFVNLVMSWLGFWLRFCKYCVIISMEKDLIVIWSSKKMEVDGQREMKKR